ncbi:MAG: Ig-like domain-containing protein [Bacteroidota bacterium]
MRRFYLLLVLLGIGLISLNAQISILLVNDNGYSTAVDSVENSLNRLGYNYVKIDAAAQAASPTYEELSAFDLVYWHTGNDGAGLYFWNGDETENQAIKDYIDGGGMLWLEGCDFLYDKYPSVPQTFLAGEFVYDYLGIANYFGQAKNDDGGGGLPEVNVVDGNGIFNVDTLKWRWSTMWYADALEKSDAASYLYQMGPADYALRDYYSAIYHEKGDGKVMTFAIRFDGINDTEDTDSIMKQGITHFEQFIDTKTLVTDVTVEAAGGVAAISENGGTLQFTATVLPADADLKAVAWSVVSDGVAASINQDGLLKASGLESGNGTIYVKAEALDGSGVKDSVAVAISGQGGAFIALLVNDNNYGSDRYMELDTALMALGYLYNICNTQETGTYPDAATLGAYDLVIWYTGNDGTDLKLWDVSDTAGNDLDTHLKFNAPLMQYIADGGNVWLQGLDFMYDIYSGAPDLFEAGDFVYDYMGIQSYAVQSKADGDPLTQIDVVADNPIVEFTPVKDSYGGLWYADGFEITGDAQGIYKMGPTDYALSSYYSGFLKENGDSKLFTLSYETARLDAASNTELLFDDVLDYFEQFATTKTLVTDITVEVEGGLAAITEHEGTLQFSVTVLPVDADLQTVTWSVIADGVTAAITQEGLLQASGLLDGNGTIYIKAEAMDGSGIADSLEVNISGQGETGSHISILLVNDNGYSTAVDSVENSLARLGYTYAKFDAALQASSPTFEQLSAFDMVYWHTGNDGAGLYFWNGDETENQAVKDYIDGGGMLWLEGTDFLYDKYPSVPQTFFTGEFVYDYLGISQYVGQAKNDDDGGGLPLVSVVDGNGIFNVDTLKWRWSGMWYADAVEKIDGASYLYRMGPEGYALRDYYSAIYNEKGDGKVMTFTIRFDGIDSMQDLDSIMKQGITHFEQFTETKTLVSEITVEPAGGATITENGGSLQFSASVLPEDADLKLVAWSVIGDGVSASISQTGLLKASGLKTGNGTVYVKAEALDGSGVADSVEVTISGQGNEFIVLLVNDNANGLDRYMELDTAMMALDYQYNIYSTPVTGTYPDVATLSAYDLVIWYTGNDGANLKLWDVSDTTGNDLDTHLKFNAPLMQYIADGGDVWIHGLDFMYDIYGGAPDFFDAGDFVYDYLGIKTYVAQSHADGDDLVQLDVVPGNPIVNFTPVKDAFGGLWFADAFEITDDAQGIYKMGPVDYIYSDYYAGFLKENGDAKIFTLSYETARLDAASNTEILFDDVIDYFESFWVGTEERTLKGMGIEFKLYPNPASNHVTIQWEGSNTSDVMLEFYSISGHLVYAYRIENSQGFGEYTLSTADKGFTPGVYFLKFSSSEGGSTRKFIVK